MIKENYKDLNYVKMMRKMMWPTGFWPGEALGEKVPLIIKWHKIQMTLQNIVGFIGQVIYIVVFFDQISFLDAGQLYITASLTFTMMARCCLISLQKYQNIMKIFFTEFHLINHKHASGYEAEIYAKLNKLSYYCTVYHMVMIMFVPPAFNALPIYTSYKAGAFRTRSLEGIDVELAVYYYYPGFNCLDYFYILTFVNVYFSFIGCVAVFSVDLLLALFVFQIIGHIKILTHNLENLPRPQQEAVVPVPGQNENVSIGWYDDGENKYINSVIVDMIKHHKFIIRFVNEVSSFFGPILGLNYLFHLVNQCVLLLACIRCEQDAMFRNLFLLAGSMGNLLVTSVTFEVVGAYSEKLIGAVYGMPWESMNNDNRKYLMLFLSRVQDPIRVTTMGVVSVGVKTMGTILRTSFSYCSFLLTIE